MDGVRVELGRAMTVRRAAARITRRRAHYALVVVFATEPGAETLTALAEIAGDAPSRRFASANTATRRTIAYGWKDAGWTQQEWSRLWERIAELGGRPYQAGDDPA